MGKVLILVGAMLIIAGVVLEYFDKIPMIGKMPGDIYIDKGNFKFYFPITTSVLISILLTIVLYVVKKLKG